MERSATDFNLNGTNLIQLVWSKKWIFLGVGVLAFIVSAIVGFSMVPFYKSTAILFPAEGTQASKELIVPSSRPHGLTVFGDDEEMEQLLQVLTSETLRTTVIERLDLYANYFIPRDDRYALYRVNRAFTSSVSFSPSRFQSVRIEVLDPNPQMAARIANEVIVVADSLMRRTKQEVAIRALAVLEKQYEQALIQSRQLEDSLTAVMRAGVLDMPMQAKELFAVYSQAVAQGNETAARRLKREMETLAARGGAFPRFYYELELNAELMMNLRESLHILRAEAKGLIPSQFVIDWATPTDRKHSPRIMMMTVLSTLAALFFALFLVVGVEFFKKSLRPSNG